MFKLLAVVTASLLVAPAAFAGKHRTDNRDNYRYYDNRYDDGRYGEDRYDDGRYGDDRHDNGRYAVDRNGRTQYARVVSAQPIYRSVRVSQPRQECWDEHVRYDEHPGYWMDDGRAGAIFGAIAGGVAGHQFGNGRGKDAATVLGALIGAGIGQRGAVENSARSYAQHTGYEQRCQSVNDYQVQERIEGYDVTYRFNGQLYHTRMPHDPGERIPVRVDVRPVSY